MAVNLSRIKAVAKKESIQVWRDPFSLAMALLMPVILLFIFAYAITFDVDRISTVVYDMDRSSASRDLVSLFRDSGYFTVLRNVGTYGEIDRAIDGGDAKVAIAIPPDFSKKLRKGDNVSIGIMLDGSDSNTAAIATGYINAIAARFSTGIHGVTITPAIDGRTRVWYNRELKSRNFIIPGLIAVIMAVIISLLTSLTIAKEWDKGTMEQLISTPIKVPELIIGKLIPYFVIGLADTILSILLGTLFFKVPLEGSVVLLLFLSAIFLFGGLCTGVLISVVARTQLLASQIAMISSFLPAFMLSGFVFAISNMPRPLQLFTYIIPARYFVTILKGVFLKGNGLRLLVLETALLSIYAVVVFVAANRAFRKRID